MITLGIDPGIATTGYGLIEEDQNGVISCLASGVIITKAHLLPQERLLQLFNRLSGLIQDFQPDNAAVEKLFFSRNVKTAISVSQARGVVLLACAREQVPVHEYSPVEVKQAVSGYGNADKKQVQEMVRTLLQMEEIVKPDDAADALAIAICHLHSSQIARLDGQ